jgi:hypothetical protein
VWRGPCFENLSNERLERFLRFKTMSELLGFPVMSFYVANDFIPAEVKQASNRGCATVIVMRSQRPEFLYQDIDQRRQELTVTQRMAGETQNSRGANNWIIFMEECP